MRSRAGLGCEQRANACVLWSLAMRCNVDPIDPERDLVDVLQALHSAGASGLHTSTSRAYALRHAGAD
ncbi:MAG: hypothetical protein Q8Q09_01440 [Deltaproteobacteria bacterium]|nr:hypothetical protein [Deltaproteobacteria bacterium]